MTQSRALSLFMPGAFAHIPEALRREFGAAHPGVDLDFHEFIPSGLLAQEIRAGAAADIYVSANTRYVEELRREGFIEAPDVLAGNRLCIITRPEHAGRVTSLDVLAEPLIRVVVPQPITDPCGQYIAQMFAEAGLTAAMHEKLATQTLLYSRGSGDLPSYLFDARADAGIFYASEAGALGDRVITIPLPPERDFHDRIAFTIGRVRRADEHPAARAFVEWMTGDAGQALLSEFRFTRRADVRVSPPWTAS